MLVGFHMKAGIPLGAGSHHKGFSDPLFLKKRKRREQERGHCYEKSCLKVYLLKKTLLQTNAVQLNL